MPLVQPSCLASLALAFVVALSGCQAKKASSSAKADARALVSGAPSASALAQAAPAPELKQKIFLVMEYRNKEPEYVHSAWFMDTAGNEYRFAAKQESDDLLLNVIADSVLNGDEVTQLVAASQPLPRRVSPEALASALKTLSTVIHDPVEQVAQSPCNELGQSYLFAYVLDPRLGVLSARFLRSEQCAQVTSRNPSEGAMELADWLEKLGKPKLPI